MFWWLLVVAAVTAFAAHRNLSWRANGASPSDFDAPATERQAFVAIGLPRLSATEEDALWLRGVLDSVLGAGYQPISLDHVAAFYRKGEPLPANPVLLAFEDARRESLEVAEPVAAAMGVRLNAFVDVGKVDEVNLSLVSRHHAGRLAATGRWTFGASQCVPEDASERALLSKWTGGPVVASHCEEIESADIDARATRSKALHDAGFQIGFIRQMERANHRDDPPFRLALVPVTREADGPTVVARLGLHAPRRETYRAAFPGTEDVSDWVPSRVSATNDGGPLVLEPSQESEGGLWLLGGTQRWKDSEIAVRLAEPATGQFWIYSRWSREKPFVRFGVLGGHARLQFWTGEGQVRQHVSVPLQGGSATLSLRVIGKRAEAFVDGRPIGDRPLEVPGTVREGSAALATWGGAASRAAIASIEARPLPRKAAIVGAAPSESAWEELRQGVDELAVLSPREFLWDRGRGSRLASADTALEIFAHYRHLLYLPTVRISGPIPAKEYAPLAEQIAEWAKDPTHDGMNLLVEGHESKAELERFGLLAEGIETRLDALGKELTLTVTREADTVDATIARWEPFWLPGSGEAPVRIVSSALAHEMALDAMR